MPNSIFSYTIKSDINEGADPFIILTVDIITDIKISWTVSDEIIFNDFADFLQKISQNKTASIGGGGNAGWHLSCKPDIDTCELCYDISGCGGDSTIVINLPKETVVSIVTEFDNLYKDYQSKYRKIINVKNLSGPPYQIDITDLETVADLKHQIMVQESIPPNQQLLVFNGCRLEDDQLITDCGIVGGSVIHQALKLRGD